jgi:hypothetical protein
VKRRNKQPKGINNKKNKQIVKRRNKQQKELINSENKE